MTGPDPPIVGVLREARQRVAASRDEDYDWSSWEDRAAALAELDRLIASAGSGQLAGWVVSGIFAPTGPLQEVSLAGGWGDEFLALAARADAALDG